MTSSRLRREIEALLYKRWRVMLDPADPRGPVLGMRTSAAPAVPVVDAVALDVLMDHGYLWYSDSAYRCYLDGGWAGYFAAGGFSSACGRIDPPALGAANEHVTLVTRAGSSQLSESSGYSGLTRLWAQAYKGAGRTWAANFDPYLGTSWTGSSLRTGCIRAPDGTYWLITAYRTVGVLAAKLVPHPDHACLVSLAASGTLSAYNQAMVDAVILGYATLDIVGGTAVTYTLLGPSDASWLAVYADTHDAINWPWCWRHQRRGAPDEDTCGAVICVHKATLIGAGPERYLHYREAALAITFTGGVPAAAVTITRQGYFQALGSQGDGVPIVALLQQSSGAPNFSSWNVLIRGGDVLAHSSEPNSELGVVASWYLPSGDLASIEYRGKYAVAFTPWTNITSCTGNPPVTTYNNDFDNQETRTGPTLHVGVEDFGGYRFYSRSIQDITISCTVGVGVTAMFKAESGHTERHQQYQVLFVSPTPGVCWVWAGEGKTDESAGQSSGPDGDCPYTESACQCYDIRDYFVADPSCWQVDSNSSSSTPDGVAASVYVDGVTRTDSGSGILITALQATATAVKTAAWGAGGGSSTVITGKLSWGGLPVVTGATWPEGLDATVPVGYQGSFVGGA